ncbi:MAG TPA: hypothetical protein PLP83_10675 [Candidatus Aminicenantes bacterium]|nr:hypothetical protein [Candidatus Aminicenantes bacterium]
MIDDVEAACSEAVLDGADDGRLPPFLGQILEVDKDHDGPEAVGSPSRADEDILRLELRIGNRARYRY